MVIGHKPTRGHKSQIKKVLQSLGARHYVSTSFVYTLTKHYLFDKVIQ